MFVVRVKVEPYTGVGKNEWVLGNGDEAASSDSTQWCARDIHIIDLERTCLNIQQSEETEKETALSTISRVRNVQFD